MKDLVVRTRISRVIRMLQYQMRAVAIKKKASCEKACPYRLPRRWAPFGVTLAVSNSRFTTISSSQIEPRLIYKLTGSKRFWQRNMSATASIQTESSYRNSVGLVG